MSTDFFESKKSIHVAVDRMAYREFRKKCFDRNVSMQAVMNEFVKLVAVEDRKAIKIIDSYVNRILKEKLENLKADVKKIEQFDHDTLYDMIEE